MEKKMYNVPSTAVTEVEALNVMVSVTASVGQEDPVSGGSSEHATGGGGDAPQRFPQF